MTLVLTIAEAADELRISEDQVYVLISRGALKACDVGTGTRSRTRVPMKSLQEFVAARTTDRPRRTA